jgi:hypothetical protein
MKAAQLRHTNLHWYPYLELGSYFRLQDGILLQRPMNQDNTMADEECEVDWNRGVSEEDLLGLKEIVQGLSEKI